MKKKLFTFIEISIVLLIIWVILYLTVYYLLSLFQNVRDVDRITTIQLLNNALKIYYKENLNYPLPDDEKEIILNTDTYSWCVFKQGIIGSGLVKILEGIGNIPYDDFYWYYRYSITCSGDKYQLMISLENFKDIKNYMEWTFRNYIVIQKENKYYLLSLPSLFLILWNRVYTWVSFFVLTWMKVLDTLKIKDISCYYSDGCLDSYLDEIASYFSISREMLEDILNSFRNIIFLDNAKVYPYNLIK